jgi:hypothetical protein
VIVFGSLSGLSLSGLSLVMIKAGTENGDRLRS